MTEHDNKILNSETGRSSTEEMALMIEGLYNGVVASLKKLKAEICNELKYSSLQINGFCEIAQKEATQMVAKNQATIMAISKELKYGYQQNQMIHEDLVHLIGEDLMAKLETVEGRIEAVGQIDKVIPAIEEAAANLAEKIEGLKFDDEPMIEKIREILVSTYEPIDYAKVSDMMETSLAKAESAIVEQTQEVVEKALETSLAKTESAVVEQTQEIVEKALESSLIKTENVIVEQTQEIVEKASVAVAEQSQQILNAINAIEMPESVDYTRIVEEVSERVLELLREELLVCEEEVVEEDEITEEETVVEEVAEETTEEVVEEAVEEVAEEETTEEEIAEEAVEEVAEETTEEEAIAEEVVEDETTEVVEEAAEEVAEEATEEEAIAEEVVEEETTEVVEEATEEESEEKPVVTEIDYDRIVERTAEKVVESLPFAEKIDYKLIEEMVQSVTLDLVVLAEEVSDKVLEKLPQPETPETIDYDRIAEVVTENVPAPEMIDYERLAETVISKMPVPEVIDYECLAETVIAKMPAPEAIDYDRLAETVIAKMPEPEAIDYDRLADTVIAKMPAPETIDYEALSDMIVSKMPKPAEPVAVDYETLAEMVAAKMVAYEEAKETPVYDVVMDAEGVEKVATSVCESLDLDIIAEKVSEKFVVAEPEKLDYDLLADMVAERLAVKVEFISEPVEEYEETVEEVAVAEESVEETAEEAVEEVAEEIVEEAVEEVAEETVEEVVEEVAEETVEEAVEEELAVAQAPEYTEDGNELVDAETGLVVRLKRSFTAKLKQSDEEVKVYYDSIKNELVSYKKVKSTVSWHGDRFNLGRSTVAKINICGKTLCFYIALDPEDPELKSTVYHQKNVGDQKAYQATPFKIKVKSEMGAKRAVRLVGILAEKIGAAKKNDFVPTDYVEEFAYETTKELLEKGLIKETKEKKIAFEF